MWKLWCSSSLSVNDDIAWKVSNIRHIVIVNYVLSSVHLGVHTEDITKIFS